MATKCHCIVEQCGGAAGTHSPRTHPLSPQYAGEGAMRAHPNMQKETTAIWASALLAPREPRVARRGMNKMFTNVHPRSGMFLLTRKSEKRIQVNLGNLDPRAPLIYLHPHTYEIRLQHRRLSDLGFRDHR